MKRKQLFFISILLYCFGGIFSYYCNNIKNIFSIKNIFLFNYFHSILIQMFSILICFILFVRNQKTNNYLLEKAKVTFSCEKCGKDTYKNWFIFLKILLIIHLFSIIFPIPMFCLIESFIGNILIDVARFLEDIFWKFFNIEGDYLGRMVDMVSIRSTLLFLKLYLFLEIYHFRKKITT